MTSIIEVNTMNIDQFKSFHQGLGKQVVLFEANINLDYCLTSKAFKLLIENLGIVEDNYLEFQEFVKKLRKKSEKKVIHIPINPEVSKKNLAQKLKIIHLVKIRFVLLSEYITFPPNISEKIFEFKRYLFTKNMYLGATLTNNRKHYISCAEFVNKINEEMFDNFDPYRWDKFVIQLKHFKKSLKKYINLINSYASSKGIRREIDGYYSYSLNFQESQLINSEYLTLYHTSILGLVCRSFLECDSFKEHLKINSKVFQKIVNFKKERKIEYLEKFLNFYLILSCSMFDNRYDFQKFDNYFENTLKFIDFYYLKINYDLEDMLECLFDGFEIVIKRNGLDNVIQ
jgi:hypothetical protein